MVNFFIVSLWMMAAYLGGGLAFLAAFFVKGLAKVDQNARESSIVFKVLIAPGIILFWPVLLNKWYHRKKTEHDS